MPTVPIERLIAALTDDQLEQFVREWAGHKKEYAEIQRFTGPGDMGRDVVGYLTKQRHDGPWHNYQCKQYGRTLPTEMGLLELGKVLYYAFSGEFTAPTAFYFVAPRGVNRRLRSYISKPASLKSILLDKWDDYCAKRIVDNQTIELSAELSAFIASWDFTNVHALATDDILLDPASKPVLFSWFGLDPGPAPIGVVPSEIEDHELPYIQQLLDAYSERDGVPVDKEMAVGHSTHGPHLRMQRERFFDADSFERFYRDNTMQQELDVLRHEMKHGIAESHAADYRDTLKRIDAVMSQASVVQPSGLLGRHARVPVRQGLCHHFANEGELDWHKK